MINNILLSNYNRTINTSRLNQSTNKATGTSSFTAALQNAVNTADKTLTSTDLDSIFERAADTYSVPVNLLKAVAKTESNFNPAAVSCCGAQGVMQLMPGTAASLGVQDSLDPEQNIMGGAKLLGQLLARYEGDTKLALAAYNAGCGNVDKYGGIPPFEETQNYVVKVMGLVGDSISLPATQTYSSGSTAASNYSNSNYSTSTGKFEYTYNDYLLFLQLILAQIQTSSLSSIGSVSDTSGSTFSTALGGQTGNAFSGSYFGL